MMRDSHAELYREQYFNEFLILEKKRFERSKDPLFLMLADISAFADIALRKNVAKSIALVLSETTRATNVKGWYVDGFVIGCLFTEMAGKEAIVPFAPKCITNKCVGSLASGLGVEIFSCIQISWQILPEKFPKDVANEGPGQEPGPSFMAKKKRENGSTSQRSDS